MTDQVYSRANEIKSYISDNETEQAKVKKLHTRHNSNGEPLTDDEINTMIENYSMMLSSSLTRLKQNFKDL